MDLGVLVLALAVTMGFPYLVLRRDRAGRHAAGTPHPWNTATFACAIGFFQLLSLPAYYWAARARGKAILWLCAVLGFTFLAAQIDACEGDDEPAARSSFSES